MNTASYKTKPYQALSPHQAVEVGFEVLAKTIGPVGIAQFLMFTSAGKGDSVQYYRRMREGKTVAETAREIKRAQQKGII